MAFFDIIYNRELKKWSTERKLEFLETSDNLLLGKNYLKKLLFWLLFTHEDDIF